MSHEFAAGLEYLEGGLQDRDHELPELSAGRVRDGYVGQVAEDVVHFGPVFYELVYRQHAVFNDYLECS